MSTNYADPAYLQKFLLSIGDILAEKISVNFSNDYNNIDNAIRLIPSASIPRVLDVNQATAVAERQSHYFSCLPAPTNDVAFELFKDHTNEEFVALNTDAYHVKNYLYLFSERPNPTAVAPAVAGATSAQATLTKRYKIDLSTLNQDMYNIDEEFFISDVTITNKSKDIFTLRANYRIEMTFNFSRFETLTKNIIPAKDETGADAKIQPLAIINILNDLSGRPTSAEISDNNGLYLTQKLTVDPLNKQPLVFEKTGKNFGKEFYRNFHMILEKHEFSLANENKVTYTPYKNVLKVSFVSYEADETDKPLRNGNIPVTTGNMFALLSKNSAFFVGTNANYNNFLNKAPFGVVGGFSAIGGGKAVNGGGFLNFLSLDDFSKALTNLNKLLKDDQLFVSCYYEYQRVKAKNPNAGFSIVNQAHIDAVRARIKGTKNLINLLEQRLRLTLLNAIIINSDVFEIEVPNAQIKVYERNEFSSKIQKELTLGNIAAGASTGFLIGQGALALASILVTEGAAIPFWVSRGVLVGGTLLGAGSAAKSAVDAASTPTVVTEGFDVIPLREAAKNFTVTKANFRTNWVNNLAKARTEALNTSDPAKKAGFSPAEASKKFFEEFDTKTKDVFGVAVPDDTDTGNRKIKFILFKDIVKLLNALVNQGASANIFIIAGGKTSYEQSKNKYNFLNCLDIPIEFNFFVKFLKKNILERKNLTYSSEEFLKDAVEQLIKFDNNLQDSAKQIPYNIRMNYSLHDSTKAEFKVIQNIAINQTATGKKHQLLNDEEYEKFKTSFIKSKMFDITDTKTSANIVKVYTIATEQEFSKVNFYNDYVDETAKKNDLSQNFNSINYQEFFIKKHGFPCIINPYLQYTTISNKFDNNLKFSRSDNAQLETGQILQQQSRLKLPYRFSCDFMYYLSFFLDVGSYIFVVAPGAPFNKENKLGFGGMYVIDTCEIKFIFKNYKNPSAEKNTSKVSIGGQHVTYADYVAPTTNTNSAASAAAPPTQSICLRPSSDPDVARLLKRNFSGQAQPNGSGINQAQTINSDESFFSDYLFGKPGDRTLF